MLLLPDFPYYPNNLINFLTIKMQPISLENSYIVESNSLITDLIEDLIFMLFWSHFIILAIQKSQSTQEFSYSIPYSNLIIFKSNCYFKFFKCLII
jgi:hypothetical protein